MDAVIEQWHADTLRAALGRREAVPHALLLAGPPGIGKLDCARLIGRMLVCTDPGDNGRACGRCQACRLAAAGTHPDIHGVELETQEGEKQAREIKIDQIRRLCAALAQTSQFGGYKIAIIEPAERMNRNAANSLLKTLEEPAGDSMLILVTARPSRLLPTVRSRCRILRMGPPPRAAALEWLRGQYPDADAGVLLSAAQGAPLAAAALAESGDFELRRSLFGGLRELADGKTGPERMAADWHRHADDRLFGWWISWVQDLIAVASAPDTGELTNPDYQKDLQALAGRIDLREFFGVYAQLQQAARLAQGSVNPQLLLESVLLDFARAARGGRQR